MKKLSMLTMLLSGILANLAMADARPAVSRPVSVPAPANRVATSEVAKPTKLSCDDFLTFDQVVRPQMVYFSEGRVRCVMRRNTAQ